MVQFLYLDSRKKKWRWPDLSISGQGPAVTIEDLHSYPVALTPEHCAFLMWANGGVPAPQYYRRVDGLGEHIECLDYLYGVRKPGSRAAVSDVADAILEFRDHLPRWSIPLGRIDDDCFLLTFWTGPREGKVWLFLWQHDWDHEGEDPDDGDGLCPLADSLAEFLGTLRDYQDFCSVASFAIDESQLQLSELKKKLRKLGCHFYSRLDSARTACDHWGWDRFGDRTHIETELFVARNGLAPELPIADFKLPVVESCEEGATILHVRVSDSYRDECVARIQRGLGRGAALVKEKGGRKNGGRSARGRGSGRNPSVSNRDKK